VRRPALDSAPGFALSGDRAAGIFDKKVA